MKTKQVIVYSKGGEEYIKLLKDCDLPEKIMLYSVKEIVKQYFVQFNEYSDEKFKSYFHTQWKLLLNVDCVLDKNSCCVLNDKQYVFMFYYISGQVKKHIQIDVKL
jgi:siderophore synthetase component